MTASNLVHPGAFTAASIGRHLRAAGNAWTQVKVAANGERMGNEIIDSADASQRQEPLLLYSHFVAYCDRDWRSSRFGISG